MLRKPYPYEKHSVLKYTFTSKGITSIEKVVIFDGTPKERIFQLGFGDLGEDGEIDDMANSNNGDMVKVLVTILHIIRDFLKEHPEAKIVFLGSTPVRTALYQRIFKKYGHEFVSEFELSGISIVGHELEEIKFDPTRSGEYYNFFIKRKL